MDPNVEDADLINRAKLNDYEFVESEGKLSVRRRKDKAGDISQ